MVTLAGGVALGSVNPFVYIIIPSYSKDGRITVSGNRGQEKRWARRVFGDLVSNGPDTSVCVNVFYRYVP